MRTRLNTGAVSKSNAPIAEATKNEELSVSTTVSRHAPIRSCATCVGARTPPQGARWEGSVDLALATTTTVTVTVTVVVTVRFHATGIRVKRPCRFVPSSCRKPSPAQGAVLHELNTKSRGSVGHLESIEGRNRNFTWEMATVNYKWKVWKVWKVWKNGNVENLGKSGKICKICKMCQMWKISIW